MNYLNRQATIGDVLSIMIAIPAIGTGILGCPYMLNVFPKFEKMFASLNTKLPLITTIILNNYIWIYTVIPIICSLTLIYFLYKSNNQILKIVLSILCLLVNMTLIQVAVMAIFIPILELQKQLN